MDLSIALLNNVEENLRINKLCFNMLGGGILDNIILLKLILLNLLLIGNMHNNNKLINYLN